MGPCMSTKNGKKNPLKDIDDHIDITLLKLIYEDLAQRSQNKLLTKEDFKIFFHLNGLWSDQLFRKFDKNQNKVIESKQFLQTIIHLVEQPFEKKINELFVIYDLEGHGSISYQTFVKMLFSYPVDELKIILQDQDFKNTLGKLEQSYYFNVQNMVNLKQQYNIDPQDQTYNELRRSKSMDHLELDQQKSINIESKENAMSGSIKLEKQMKKKSQEKRKKFLSELKLGQQVSLKKMSSQACPSSQQQIDVSNLALAKCFSDPKATKCKIHIKKCKIVSNLTLMVKKYAKYIFDKNSQSGLYLTQQAFSKVVKQHPRIIYPFQQSFHSYIWRLNENHKPRFCSEKTKYESQCQIVDKNQTISGYMKYIKNTILVFHKKNDIIPIQIKCLEGLNVKSIQNDNPHKIENGIIFKHKDGIYPEKKYLFKGKAELANWMKLLEEYTCNTIIDRYELKQMIGSGNYSKVWKAIEKDNSSPQSNGKSTNSLLSQQNNKFTAIKIIDKSTLSKTAYDSIKFQCELLNLIHHPYIIKMITKEQTKSNIFIVTEYFSQGSLFQYEEEKNYLDEYEAAIVIKQLLQAISHLVQLGIVHRDLKPQNIMVVYDQKKMIVRKVKIIDFGFATYLESLKDVEQDLRAKGTPGFVPPEAILSKAYYENSDLFSVGVILYQMLSGYLPFQGDSKEQTLWKNLQCNLSFVDKASFSWGKISSDAKDFLKKLITFSSSRMSVEEALNHRWLLNMENLRNDSKNYSNQCQF